MLLRGATLSFIRTFATKMSAAAVPVAVTELIGTARDRWVEAAAVASDAMAPARPFA